MDYKQSIFRAARFQPRSEDLALGIPFCNCCSEREILEMSTAAYKGSLKVPSCTLLFQGILLRHKVWRGRLYGYYGHYVFLITAQNPNSSKKGTQRCFSWDSSRSPRGHKGSSLTSRGAQLQHARREAAHWAGIRIQIHLASRLIVTDRLEKALCQLYTFMASCLCESGGSSRRETHMLCSTGWFLARPGWSREPDGAETAFQFYNTIP